MRIGLIADTHMPGALEQIWPQVLEAFEGVDAILHAGDLHTLDIIHQLEEVAPVRVARGNGDVGIEDSRLRDAWMVEFDAVRVGMIHRFPSPQRRPDALADHAARHFGSTLPHVIVYGHTHYEALYEDDARLYINPGSPTLPRNQSLRLGTIGLLDIDTDAVTATIHRLTSAGTAPHEEIAPLRKHRQALTLHNDR